MYEKIGQILYEKLPMEYSEQDIDTFVDFIQQMGDEDVYKMLALIHFETMILDRVYKGNFYEESDRNPKIWK
jgi:hypothetical protein